jgi:hypothetical protein
MRLADARIGYAGYSADFSQPGDRRRFSAYAQMRGLVYERAAIERDYDLVVVTHGGDLPGWTARKQREGQRLKFVFELIDTYFADTSLPRRLLKGAARYALGIDSRPSPDFLKTLIHACEGADSVICSTIEQQETIRRYNPNVHVSFDWFGGDLRSVKRDYRRAGKLRIVWEGQSTTLSNLRVIREVLNELKELVELHVITDRVTYRHLGRFAPYPSMDTLRGFECPIFFHEWRKETFCAHIAAADVAVIPIEEANPVFRGKPENKLILFWQLGLPVLTTATPAYTRTMARAGLDMACTTLADWKGKLDKLILARGQTLESLGEKCKTFASEAYSAEQFQSRFDAAFKSVGFDPAIAR